MTIALFGLFGSPNLGNEATLAAFLFNMRLRTPSASYVCVAPINYSVERVYGVAHLPLDPMPVARLLWRVQPRALREALAATQTLVTEPFRRGRAVRMLRGVTALFIPGTGIVDDFGQGPLDMPLHLDRWTDAAIAVGARVAFVSIGATRVDSAVSRRLFGRSLRRAEYCSFRDQASVRAACRLGIARAANVTADLAFSLPEQLRHTDGAAWPPRTIGVGLMGYYGWNTTEEEGRRIYGEYVGKMASLIDWLLARRLRVRLLIGDTRADKDVRTDVLRALKARGRGVEDGRLVAAAITDYVALIEEIKRCDLVVATRFHNILLSLWLNRPAVSIAYDRKNDALMAEVGLGRHCHPIEGLDLAAVRASVEELIATATPPLDALNAYRERQRAVLMAQYDELAALLNSA